MRPPFPLVDIDRSPQTPVRNSTFVAYDPDKTHPIDDPFYSSPVIGLRFQEDNKGRGLSREGAFIIDEFAGYEHCQGMNFALLFSALV